MSWTYSPQQVMASISAQRAALAEQWKKLEEAELLHRAEMQKIDLERKSALDDLAKAVLPALDPPHIARAAQLTGLLGLPAENLPKKREERRAYLLSRLRAIGADVRYRDRELLRHPRTGSLPCKVQENVEHRQPLADVVQRCETHPRFSRLMEIGFGTEEHGTPWWRFSHWSDRSAAAEILERFPGATTFLDVREQYRVAKEAVIVFDAELRMLRQEIAAGEALDREYTALWNEHHNLDDIALAHTRDRIIAHMMQAHASFMAQRLSSNKAIHLLFLRASGLSSKMNYLDAIYKKNTEEMRTELNAQKAKIDGVYTRAVAKGRGMPHDKFQAFAVDRRAKYDKRWQRWNKTYLAVHGFNRWDRGRLYEELLWWDLMTRGRHDGSYIHEVVTFHHVHPHYQYDPAPPRPHFPREAPDSREPVDPLDPPDQGDATDPTVDDSDDEGDAAAASADRDEQSRDAGVDDRSGSGGDDLTTTDAS